MKKVQVILRASIPPKTSHAKRMGLRERIRLAKWIYRKMLPPAKIVALDAEAELGFTVRRENVLNIRRAIMREIVGA